MSSSSSSVDLEIVLKQKHGAILFKNKASPKLNKRSLEVTLIIIFGLCLGCRLPSLPAVRPRWKDYIKLPISKLVGLLSNSNVYQILVSALLSKAIQAKLCQKTPTAKESFMTILILYSLTPNHSTCRGCRFQQPKHSLKGQSVTSKVHDWAKIRSLNKVSTISIPTVIGDVKLRLSSHDDLGNAIQRYLCVFVVQFHRSIR